MRLGKYLFFCILFYSVVDILGLFCRATEPWRHGIQVYAFPFPIDIKEAGTEERPQGVAIRRVRHAEVVLVDDVCIAHGRYWLRLKWPGKGGFAGYIALGASSPYMTRQTTGKYQCNISRYMHFSGLHHNLVVSCSPFLTEISDAAVVPTASDMETLTEYPSPSEEAAAKIDSESANRVEESQENAGYFQKTADDDERMPSPKDGQGPMQCMRTGLYFPSSSAMQLLALYDDGLNPTVSQPPSSGEPVFCRICREGLHDDEEQAPEETPQDDDVVVPPPTTSDSATETGPLIPHPTYHSNNYAAENPLLAPCECSGSMAFVHYLCVEQWRCRSRHPEARNGLHCETCGSAYALPPPSSRPASQLAGVVNEEDWLEAMPAHVMNALRQPHICWQVGAAIVRRRWLRPMAPVIMSPVVALYCRARRLLKKRGVSRRRWACSLCRRRARWKCVRCLRSYYCSRQCQNVSWHIVHKHVCYKPSRFWWSIVVYTLLALALFPGIIRDPLIYDFGISLVPVSFFVIGSLAGGIAQVMKKCFLVDMRGRMLELSVLLVTLWLVNVSWGLVWAFFGDVSQCKGVFGPASTDSKVLTAVRHFLFVPSQVWFNTWDRLALQTPQWLSRFLCQSTDHCFANSHLGNPDFYLESDNCASDVMLVSELWMSAAVVLVITSALKKHERRARGRARRPHQD